MHNVIFRNAVELISVVSSISFRGLAEEGLGGIGLVDPIGECFGQQVKELDGNIGS